MWDALYSMHLGLMRRSFTLLFYFFQTQSTKTKQVLQDGSVLINPQTLIERTVSKFLQDIVDKNHLRIQLLVTKNEVIEN